MIRSVRQELLDLMETLFERELSFVEHARLEHLVIHDAECRRLYVQAIEIHGHLSWDAGGIGVPDDLTSDSPGKAARMGGIRRTDHPLRRAVRFRFAAAALLLMIGLSAWFVAGKMGGLPWLPPGGFRPAEVAEAGNAIDGGQFDAPSGRDVPSVRISSVSANGPVPVPTVPAPMEKPPQGDGPRFAATSDDQVVALINTEVRSLWDSAELVPTPPAADTEWVRRVHLDLAGRIPTPGEVEEFTTDRRPDKQQRLVESLVEGRNFARHLATVWTNLLVGRSREDEFDRPELFAWLESQFDGNRSWRETVTELVTARGNSGENAPVNFLLAHMNNQAVPATAVTSRILLCEQLQCAQCHRHPQAKDWAQDRFWELNAFFQQAVVQTRVRLDQETGERTLVRELIDSSEFAPTYYENLQGVMRIAFPRFAGTEITAPAEVPLRDRLAELMFDGDAPQTARAFVNRTWGMLLGYGFTNPIDDMGPHSPVSHPELLQGLSEAFAASGYDVKRLVKWICLSQPYQLAGSGPGSSRTVDAPEDGEPAYFSRMYVKPLSAEQIFDSLLIASGVSPAELHRRSLTGGDRERWLRQFFTDMETEENTEMTTFDGSMPQTLSMMNGELVQRAVNPESGLVVQQVLARQGASDAERIRQLCLAALSRYPSDEELTAIRQALRRHVKQRTDRNVPAQVAFNEGLRDVYWAYLNSSEFLVNH